MTEKFSATYTIESRMIEAHKLGRTCGALHNEMLQDLARFARNDPRERESFIAGYIGELKRLNRHKVER